MVGVLLAVLWAQLLDYPYFTGSRPFRIASQRLSGKKSADSRDFCLLFRIFESGLRVFLVGPQAADHPLDGCDLNPGLAMTEYVFVIPIQPPATSQASQRLLRHPTDFQWLEPRRTLGPRPDLDPVGRA